MIDVDVIERQENQDEATIMEWRETGFPNGISLGWKETDPYIRLFPGSLTVVTGTPGSGKSNWVDQVIVNMFKLHGIYPCLFSPENHPTALHRIKFCEKLTQKPFDKKYGEPMSEQELKTTLELVIKSIKLVNPDRYDVETLLGYFDYYWKMGCRLFVIDPWTEVEKERPQNTPQSDYLNELLSRFRNWAQKREAFLVIVAHPSQPEKKDPKKIMGLYDIYGGSNWANKIDFLVSVQRDFEYDNTNNIFVLKVRQGRLYGKVTKEPICFSYDPATEIMWATGV